MDLDGDIVGGELPVLLFYHFLVEKFEFIKDFINIKVWVCISRS